MFKTIKNIGCLGVVIIAGWIFFNVYNDMESHASARPAEVRRDPNAAPSAATIEQMFTRADREELRAKYGPKSNVDRGGTPRVGNHRDGWFYIREYVGHDELGRTVQGYSGFLYKTNSATAWTYYTQDALPGILPEVTVNGKPLSDFLKK